MSNYFADILKGNALNNRLLRVQVSAEFLDQLFVEITKDTSVEIKVDLEAQKIEIPKKDISESFDIDPYKKTCMINGFDDIDFLVSKLDAIKEFERKKSHKTQATTAL
mgnify:CR=1 FL=1